MILKHSLTRSWHSINKIHAGSVRDLGMVFTRFCLNVLARLDFKIFFLGDNEVHISKINWNKGNEKKRENLLCPHNIQTHKTSNLTPNWGNIQSNLI